MAKQNAVKLNSRKFNIKVRSILLGLQIVIPFMVYYFLQEGWAWGSYLLAGLLVLSMVILLWQK